MLEVRDLHVRFGEAHILQGVSIALGGAPLAIVGRNGMGKTTLCQAIMGMIRPSEGEVTLDGRPLTGQPPYRIARQGLAIVPQGRRTFASLSVHEHLKLVGQGRGARWTIERVYETFPRLAERRRNGGTELSGGEQQMLAIARALLMNPKVVIMDEPSEGLAPVIVDQLIAVLRALPKDGVGLLLVEQNLRVATAVAPEIAIMVTGRIATSLPAATLAEDVEIQRRYLGVAAGGHH
jgi:branched-chain amino acid transport system ATP-binding protein